MARLPTPGGDDGTWGDVLNDFLGVEHNADGTLKNAVKKGDLVINVADYGAVGNGITDDTAAVQAAINAIPSNGGKLFIPPKTYVCASSLTVPSNITIEGSGFPSQLYYTGSGVFIALINKGNIKFHNFTTTVASAGATAFDISNSFRCSWIGMTVRGSHLDSTGSTYHTQIGFNLRNNCGDNRIIDCDINNLGVAINTEAIMNYVIGGVIGTCWRGVYGGVSNNFNAGLSVAGTTFVSKAAATEHHVYIVGQSNLFWFDQVWFEGCDIAIEVGVIGTGGPSNFGMNNCMIASTTKSLIINAAKQTTLTNIHFSNEGSGTPVELTIDATNAPEGTAVNLVSAQVFSMPDTLFPAGWMVSGRGYLRVPSTVIGPLLLQGKMVTTSTIDADVPFQVNAPGTLTNNLVEFKKGGSTPFTFDRFSNFIAGGGVYASATAGHRFNGTSNFISTGSGTPEGVLTAPVGSLYLRTNGAAGTTLYIKESGAGNTGWVTQPSDGALVHLAGAESITGAKTFLPPAATTPILIQLASSPTADAFQVKDSSLAPLMNISSTGKVGIGVAVPAALFEANGVVRSTRVGVPSQYIQLDGGDAGAIRLTAVGKPLFLDSTNVGIGVNPTFADGVGVFGMKNAGTVPTTNPTAGGLLYAEGGALKWRGSSGTVTVIAPA